MLAKDLIILLKEKIKQHEPMKNIMGELSIVVDKFEKVDDDTHTFKYKGWDPNVELEFDNTTGDYIINAFVPEREKHRKS